MKVLRSSIIISLVLIFSLSGCRKYEEGPLIDLYSIPKRVQGKWWFDRVEFNGIDSSIHYKYARIEFGLYDKERGGFVFEPNVYEPDLLGRLIGGTWGFLAERDSFEMKYLHTKDTLVHQWKIKRLAYNEFWMERHDESSNLIYWKLWKFVY